MSNNNTTQTCVSHQHLQNLLFHSALVDLYRSKHRTIPLQRVTGRLTQALAPHKKGEIPGEETRALVSLLGDLAVEVDRIVGYTKTPAPPGDTIVFPRITGGDVDYLNIARRLRVLAGTCDCGHHTTLVEHHFYARDWLDENLPDVNVRLHPAGCSAEDVEQRIIDGGFELTPVPASFGRLLFPDVKNEDGGGEVLVRIIPDGEWLNNNYRFLPKLTLGAGYPVIVVTRKGVAGDFGTATAVAQQVGDGIFVWRNRAGLAPVNMFFDVAHDMRFVGVREYGLLPAR